MQICRKHKFMASSYQVKLVGKKNNPSWVNGEERESPSLGKTPYLDLARACGFNRSFLGLNFPYPHHDPAKDYLFLDPSSVYIVRKKALSRNSLSNPVLSFWKKTANMILLGCLISSFGWHFTSHIFTDCFK